MGQISRAIFQSFILGDQTICDQKKWSKVAEMRCFKRMVYGIKNPATFSLESQFVRLDKDDDVLKLR